MSYMYRCLLVLPVSYLSCAFRKYDIKVSRSILNDRDNDLTMQPWKWDVCIGGGGGRLNLLPPDF